MDELVQVVDDSAHGSGERRQESNLDTGGLGEELRGPLRGGGCGAGWQMQ
ncbi:hypothetical protein TRIUR3_05447 [Triticum urartu]|uniref:Uncharacterized protein n=1 Tax=Triticum urartu TaxID=4572 RepID=M7ZP56_TRIUA|nr:hypothetical protein TRIUR3_05447 [Triticum urartu]